jgi:hypothetical protein
MGRALAGFGVSMFTAGKFIGAEILGVVQAPFVGLSVVGGMGPLIGQIVRIGYVNGINTFFSDNRQKLISDGIITSNEIPYRIGGLSYGSQVAYSFNYTVLLLLLPLIISLALFIASKVTRFP